MLIGMLSDSHGRHLLVRKAVALFDALGVSHVIHCGDVGGTDVFDELVGRSLTFVWGNTDVPTGDLLAYLQTVGLRPPDSVPTKLTLDGTTFAVFHGHEREFQTALDLPGVDYIFHGHTHAARNETIAGKRVINPGALHRVPRRTVATLDTTTGTLTFHEIRLP